MSHELPIMTFTAEDVASGRHNNVITSSQVYRLRCFISDTDGASVLDCSCFQSDVFGSIQHICDLVFNPRTDQQQDILSIVPPGSYPRLLEFLCYVDDYSASRS